MVLQAPCTKLVRNYTFNQTNPFQLDWLINSFPIAISTNTLIRFYYATRLWPCTYTWRRLVSYPLSIFPHKPFFCNKNDKQSTYLRCPFLQHCPFISKSKSGASSSRTHPYYGCSLHQGRGTSYCNLMIATSHISRRFNCCSILSLLSLSYFKRARLIMRQS